MLLCADLVWRYPGYLYAVAGGTDQCDGHPNLDVAAHPRVGLLPFRREADGYAFKRSLCLHTEKAIHRHGKGVEGTMLLEARLHIILLLLWLMKTLIRWLFPVREGIGVYDTHVVNNIRPSLSDVTDEKVYLLLRVFCSLWWIVGKVYHRMGLSLSHVMNLVDEGVSAHVWWGEGFACKASDPITELVMASRDEAALLKIQGVTYGKFGVTTITVNWEVWGIYAIVYKVSIRCHGWEGLPST